MIWGILINVGVQSVPEIIKETGIAIESPTVSIADTVIRPLPITRRSYKRHWNQVKSEK